MAKRDEIDEGTRLANIQSKIADLRKQFDNTPEHTDQSIQIALQLRNALRKQAALLGFARAPKPSTRLAALIVVVAVLVAPFALVALGADTRSKSNSDAINEVECKIIGLLQTNKAFALKHANETGYSKALIIKSTNKNIKAIEPEEGCNGSPMG